MNLPGAHKIRSGHDTLFIGFFLLLAFIVAAGIIGLYALNKSHVNARDYIDAIDSSREVQVLLQKQIQIWKTTVLEGDNFDRYKNNFYEFSRYSSQIQELMFNLKMTSKSFEEIPDDIAHIIVEHKKISEEYISLLVSLEEKRFSNKDDIISAARGKDAMLLGMADKIVVKIKTYSQKMINRINQYYLAIVFAVLVIMVLMALFLTSYLLRRIFLAQRILERKVSERTYDLVEANKKIKLSEEKYRLIVEGSQDVIFCLDESLNFLSANKAVQVFLKISPEKIEGKNFINLVNNGNPDNHMNAGIVREKIQLLKEERIPIEFISEIKTPLLIEPVPMRFRLEYITVDNKNEILGRASSAIDDGLINYLAGERRKYRIDNSLITADDLSLKITGALYRNLSPGDVKMTRIALREILVNAIEHGNLNITFEEKSTALMNDSYFNLLNSRRNDPRYREKKVSIEYVLEPGRVVYCIRDQGNGFDHSRIPEADAQSPSADMPRLHGRGISIARQVFDLVRYNKAGNEVLLVKYFESEAER